MAPWTWHELLSTQRGPRNLAPQNFPLFAAFSTTEQRGQVHSDAAHGRVDVAS